ncbi:MAG: response regulator transcription factor [Woeseiaceae bacterium]|nr:response regulator transcription factor [Woeseiaceae bacterium]
MIIIMTVNANILIVDDDQELGDMLREFLAPDHFEVTICLSGEDGLQALREREFNLVILDIMLPGISGIDVLREVRLNNDVPIIMLTARGDDVDRILGLEFGADDYLTKPFNPRELLARIKAIMRRVQPGASKGHRITIGVVELDLRARRVSAGDEHLRLTGTEFELLLCLAESPGETVTKERLSQKALGRRHMPYDRSIDTHISNVRGKLAAAGVASPFIQSRRGVGYCLLVEE